MTFLHIVWVPPVWRSLLAALGDCAVTANVPSMRNTVPVAKLLQAVYVSGADSHAAAPTQGIPPLLPQARPLHDFVKVDAHLPGCPPRPEALLQRIIKLQEKIAGEDVRQRYRPSTRALTRPLVGQS